MTYGESFTPVEALALHVKALATMQQCLATLQEQEPTSPLPQTPSHTPLLAALQQPPGAASGEVDARLQAIRVRFGELLQSAERIRNSLRTPRPEPATRADISPRHLCTFAHRLSMARRRHGLGQLQQPSDGVR